MRILVIILLLITNLSLAQEAVKEYFTKDGKVTDAGNSYYYQVGKKGKIKGEELDKFADSVSTFYSATNRIRSREFYKKGSLEGPYVRYYENGQVKENGSYEQGFKSGAITYWYDNGSVQWEIYHYPYFIQGKPTSRDSFRIVNYWDEANQQLVKNGAGYCKCQLPPDEIFLEGNVVDGYKDGVWKGVAGDTLTFTEQYKNGVFVKGESLYKGKRIEYKELFQQAEFKGGINGLMDFLRRNIQYPKTAKRSGQQGKVFVKFMVNANGVLSGYEILKGVDVALNREALRVVILTDGRWTPAKSRGVPVKSQFVLPIFFKLDY